MTVMSYTCFSTTPSSGQDPIEKFLVTKVQYCIVCCACPKLNKRENTEQDTNCVGKVVVCINAFPTIKIEIETANGVHLFIFYFRFHEISFKRKIEMLLNTLSVCLARGDSNRWLHNIFFNKHQTVKVGLY